MHFLLCIIILEYDIIIYVDTLSCIMYTQKNLKSRTSVHYSYLSYQVDSVVNESKLNRIFEKYGIIVELVIVKSHIDEVMKYQSGYGFVHFLDTEDGADAVFRISKALYNISIDHVYYTCKISNISYKFFRQYPFLIKKYSNISANAQILN